MSKGCVCACFFVLFCFQAPLRVAGCVPFFSGSYPQGAFCRLARRGGTTRSAAEWRRVPRTCGADFDAVMCVGTEKLLGVAFRHVFVCGVFLCWLWKKSRPPPLVCFVPHPVCCVCDYMVYLVVF